MHVYAVRRQSQQAFLRWTVYLATALSTFGFSLPAPYFPQWLLDQGGSPSGVGIVFAAYGAAPLVLASLISCLLRYIRPRTLALIACLVACASAAAFGALQRMAFAASASAAQLVMLSAGLRGMQGLAATAVCMAGFTVMVATYDMQAAELPRHLGVVQVFAVLGLMCGPPAGGLINASQAVQGLPAFMYAFVWLALGITLTCIWADIPGSATPLDAGMRHAMNTQQQEVPSPRWRSGKNATDTTATAPLLHSGATRPPHAVASGAGATRVIPGGHGVLVGSSPPPALRTAEANGHLGGDPWGDFSEGGVGGDSSGGSSTPLVSSLHVRSLAGDGVMVSTSKVLCRPHILVLLTACTFLLASVCFLMPTYQLHLLRDYRFPAIVIGLLFGMMASAFMLASAAYVNAGATVPLRVGGTAIVIAGLMSAAGGYVLIGPAPGLPATLPLQIVGLVLIGWGACLGIVPIVPIMLSESLVMGGGSIEATAHIMWRVFALSQVLGPLVLGIPVGRLGDFSFIAPFIAVMLVLCVAILALAACARGRIQRGFCSSVWAISVRGSVNVLLCIDDTDRGAYGEPDVWDAENDQGNSDEEANDFQGGYAVDSPRRSRGTTLQHLQGGDTVAGTVQATSQPAPAAAWKPSETADGTLVFL